MIKFKLYSRYDLTDAIKSSKDSSILNKEESHGISNTALLAGAGGLIGAAGAEGGKLKKAGKGAKGALIGAAVGAGLHGLKVLDKRNQDRQFYNKRLREAQRAARRREVMDWNEKIHDRNYYE